MTFLAALVGFFKFFDEVSAFIKLLEKTPVEKHQKILERISSESTALDKNGRPIWD